MRAAAGFGFRPVQTGPLVRDALSVCVDSVPTADDGGGSGGMDQKTSYLSAGPLTSREARQKEYVTVEGAGLRER